MYPDFGKEDRADLGSTKGIWEQGGSGVLGIAGSTFLEVAVLGALKLPGWILDSSINPTDLFP